MATKLSPAKIDALRSASAVDDTLARGHWATLRSLAESGLIKRRSGTGDSGPDRPHLYTITDAGITALVANSPTYEVGQRVRIPGGFATVTERVTDDPSGLVWIGFHLEGSDCTLGIWEYCINGPAEEYAFLEQDTEPEPEPAPAAAAEPAEAQDTRAVAIAALLAESGHQLFGGHSASGAVASPLNADQVIVHEVGHRGGHVDPQQRIRAYAATLEQHGYTITAEPEAVIVHPSPMPAPDAEESAGGHETAEVTDALNAAGLPLARPDRDGAAVTRLSAGRAMITHTATPNTIGFLYEMKADVYALALANAGFTVHRPDTVSVLVTMAPEPLTETAPGLYAMGGRRYGPTAIRERLIELGFDSADADREVGRVDMVRINRGLPAYIRVERDDAEGRYGYRCADCACEGDWDLTGDAYAAARRHIASDDCANAAPPLGHRIPGAPALTQIGAALAEVNQPTPEQEDNARRIGELFNFPPHARAALLRLCGALTSEQVDALTTEPRF